MSLVRKKTTLLIFSALFLVGAIAYTAFYNPTHDYNKRKFKTVGGRLLFKNQPYTGTLFKKYKNQKIQKEEHYKLGKKHGKQRHWFESGQQLWEENYLNGKKEGHQFGWHRNGEKRFLTHYKNGKREGEQWTWYPNKQVASFQLITNKKEIKFKRWRPDGKIFSNYLTHNQKQVGFEGNELCKSKAQ